MNSLVTFHFNLQTSVLSDHDQYHGKVFIPAVLTRQQRFKRLPMELLVQIDAKFQQYQGLKHNMATAMRIGIFSTGVLSFWALITANGCSLQEPPPLEMLGAAKMAVQDAERSDHTAQFAPAELQSAKQKVQAAEQAIAEQQNTLARRLSEQAIVDAQLATAKTLTTQYRIGANEQLDALRDVQSGTQ